MSKVWIDFGNQILRCLPPDRHAQIYKDISKGGICDIPRGNSVIGIVLSFPSPTVSNHSANDSALKRSTEVIRSDCDSSLIFFVSFNIRTSDQKGACTIDDTKICAGDPFGMTGRHCRKSPTYQRNGHILVTCKNHWYTPKPFIVLAKVFQCTIDCFKTVSIL